MGGMYGNFPFQSNVNIYTRAKDLSSSKPCKKFIYKTHHRFEKCTKVLKPKGNLKDVKLAQMRCQKLSISTTNRL
jgi:hypothetical protein